MAGYKEPMIKIGGGSFATSYVLGFESKKQFIDANLYLAEAFHNAPEEYLSDIYELAHRSDDFKQGNGNDAVEVQATNEKTPEEPPVIEKVSLKKKSNAKKE